MRIRNGCSSASLSSIIDEWEIYLPICNSLFILPVWLMSPIYEEGANSASYLCIWDALMVK